MQSELTLHCGTLVHAPAPHTATCTPDGAIVVGNGRIVFAGARRDAATLYAAARCIDYGNAVLLPGLIDTHVHLPQWPIAGTGRGELLHWLHTIVFPVEAAYADPALAYDHSLRFFRDALACGTTCMAVYCSPFRTAAHEAFRAAAATGVRVVMGRTLMDTGAPASLLASADDNLADCERLAADWHLYDGGRLRYAVTPRFALSCTPGLMQRAAEFARAGELCIQTHLAENPDELRAVAREFPDDASYTRLYERMALLGERSILAHCIHLAAEDQRLLLDRGCVVAHCPSSNRFLQSGVMPLRRYLRTGHRVALGSDVGAGYSLSMLNEAREAVESSKTWNILHRGEEERVLAPEEALWLATQAGAEALGLGDVTGSFFPGKDADFIVVEPHAPPHNPASLSIGDRIAHLLYGTPRVLRTYVRGTLCYAATAT